MTNNLQQGQRGENIAADFLERRGFTIVARNFRCRSGELDLVARQNDLLLVIEVKARNGRSHGRGAESVTWQKQQKIVRATQYYLATRGNGREHVRFDVLEVDLAAPERDPLWYQSAFETQT